MIIVPQPSEFGTAAELLCGSEVYVCGKFAGDMPGNTDKIKAFCLWIKETYKNKVIPFAPHMYLPALYEELTERRDALNACFRLLNRFQGMWVLLDRTQKPWMSDGMRYEIIRCRQSNKPIAYFALTDNKYVFEGLEPNTPSYADDKTEEGEEND